MAAGAVAGTLVKIKLSDGREVTANIDQSVVALLSSPDPEVRRDVEQAIIKSVSASDESQAEVSAQSESQNSTAGTRMSTDQMEDKKLWTEQEAKALVQLRMDMESEFNKAKVHKRLCQIVSSKMLTEFNHTVTADQCSNKWKSIKRAYKETIDNNGRTGESKKMCKFYDELNFLYGMKDGTNPQITMGSLPSTTCTSKTNSDTDSDPDSAVVPTRTPARKIRKKAPSPTLKWLEEYAEKQVAAQDKRENLAKEMHNDKMKRFDKLLGILETQNK